MRINKNNDAIKIERSLKLTRVNFTSILYFKINNIIVVYKSNIRNIG